MPNGPSGSSIASEFLRIEETVLTLVWSAPTGSEPADIVDNYVIYLMPPSPDSRITVPAASPFNVSLAHNVVYTLNVTASNCYGESEPDVIPNHFIGM